MSSELISALQDPALYDHPVDGFRVFETHISWVILTGEFAYKIKKPMDFGFLNFSTLERRRTFCHEEVRLNRRMADSLYLDVLPITGSASAPVLNGDGEPFEYAIRMRQFDQAGMLDGMQERGELTSGIIRDLAHQTALFHRNLPTDPPDDELGTAGAIGSAMQENFDQVRPMLEDADLLRQVDELEAWTQSTFERHRDRIQKRRDDGFVRECHGDLHLSNITLQNGQATVFDCIEFNDSFRWIDVLNDLAFLLMDLESRDEYGLATEALNTWLEYTGDYEGLALLPLYKAYRAMVRAKIALFTRENPDLDDEARAELLDSYRRYAALADTYTRIPNAYLLATTGLSGSGKSVISAALSRSLGLVRLRSDVERKRLFGLDPLEQSHSEQEGNLYTAEATRETYDRLSQLAGALLQAGMPVIVDSAALKQQEREQLESVAANLGLPFCLIDCEAPEETRRQWVRERQGDASEATESLLDAQRQWAESLTEEERTHTIHVRTDAEGAAELLAERIRGHFRVDPRTDHPGESASPA
ncbi:hypothetical protein C8D92_104278 [Tamilnaduibacter salinus]|uniref:Aminoglycoside phosphotransferase domain-containing protein n=1 Tax=Tamilnaduibacter salinus TaxID=1484056 RepID=A0A2U1CXS2_9GAMM|nr:hypothetical protein C8D92_104278 [Tamilnaduibacter salinus]